MVRGVFGLSALFVVVIVVVTLDCQSCISPCLLFPYRFPVRSRLKVTGGLTDKVNVVALTRQSDRKLT